MRDLQGEINELSKKLDDAVENRENYGMSASEASMEDEGIIK